MPAVDTTYLVGVIREWEKGFLETDEYTRIIEAPNVTAAARELHETPYGRHFKSERDVASVYTALDRHLVEIHSWLRDTLDDERVLQFVSARYDGLNMITALLRHREGMDGPGQFSPLGLIPHDILAGAIWHGLGWDILPEFWESALRNLLASSSSPTTIMRTIARQTVAYQDHVSFTPLMRTLTNLFKEHAHSDRELRPFGDHAAARDDDRRWDEKLLHIIRHHRLAVSGYDPVLAFWYAKELEVKQIRLLLSAKSSQLPTAAMYQLQRGLYRTFAL